MNASPTATATIQQMTDLLEQAQHSDCSRQRNALSSIGYRAQLVGTTPLAFLRDYFYAQFQATDQPATGQPAAVDAQASIRCRSCGKVFSTQTALNGHGEARCLARKTSPIQP